MVTREVMYLIFNILEPGSTEANQPSLTYPDTLIYPGAACYLHTQNQIAWAVAPPKKIKVLEPLGARRRRMGTTSAYSNSSSAIATEDPAHIISVPFRNRQDM
jgi:hypothetical protein